MKPQTPKKLFAFIIMMFSISYLNAQCPDNKVKLYKPSGRTNCISKCVPQSQVERYLSNGWSWGCFNGGSGFFAKTTGKKIPNKPVVKTPTENANVSKKTGSR
jgi:hypothetical protein